MCGKYNKHIRQTFSQARKQKAIFLRHVRARYTYYETKIVKWLLSFQCCQNYCF